MDKNLEGPFLGFWKTDNQLLAKPVSRNYFVINRMVCWLACKKDNNSIAGCLRFEKLFMRIQWRRALSKADIRYAVFNLMGNVVFFIVFLIFLNSALDAMKLTVLSTLIQQGVVFIPKLIIALIILGIGWVIATRISTSVYNALLKENLPHYSIISRFVKFVAVLFFSSMALVEIDIAPQIVIIGFTSIMITLGVILITVTVFSSKSNLNNFLNVGEKKQD